MHVYNQFKHFNHIIIKMFKYLVSCLMFALTTSRQIIMLPTHNSALIESIATNVSNPVHVDYGKFITKEEVDQIVRNDLERKPWIAWFNDNSISYDDVGDGFILHDDYEIPSALRKSALRIMSGGRRMKRRTILDKHDSHPGISPRSSINALYSLPDVTISDERVTQSVIEYQNDPSYSASDAKVFLESVNLPPINVTKIGPFNGDEPDGEATLDIQIQVAVGRGAKQYYITTTGWLYEAALTLLAMKSPPIVNSMSWGWNAHDQCTIMSCGNMTSIQYIQRVNLEYAKLAARGVTMLSSSGDSGSYGRTNSNCDDVDDGGPLRPVFPTSSPWVTSVGGTVVIDPVVETKGSKLCDDKGCIVGGTQRVCTFNRTSWTSGGGISWDFALPDWQKDAAASYYASQVKKPPSKYYNKSGRIYPDVALVANDYLIYWQGEWTYLAGTSASCPAFSGMLSHWNAARFQRNQSAVGAVNAMLYHLHNVCDDCFTDVEEGTNDSTEMGECGTGWYTATKGYDPVYGLGLPNMTAIMRY